MKLRCLAELLTLSEDRLGVVRWCLPGLSTWQLYLMEMDCGRERNGRSGM